MDNLSLIMRHIATSSTPLSRAAIASMTGLTRATSSRLVDELIGAGVIEEFGESKPRVGRPAVMLRIKGGRNTILGLEVNLAYLAVYLLDLDGSVHVSRVIEHDSRDSDPAETFATLSKLIGEALASSPATPLQTILCIPGLVSEDHQGIVTAPNLGWHDVRPSHYLSFPGFDAGRLTVLNEADASSYSVLFSAPGRKSGIENFVYISAEVGVGAALVFDGEVFEGQRKWAGEIGHMTVDRNGPTCRCGSNGCLEQYAGFDSILRNAGLGSHVTLPELITLFDEGDPNVRKAVDACAMALGTSIANVLNLLDVGVVVLGGNLVSLHSRMQVILEAELHYRALAQRWDMTSIRTSEYGKFAASRGACLAGFEHFLRNLDKWNSWGIPVQFQ
ncbi:MAG: ROK family transcriptional regulator [Actinomycetaceae bacterium]|nr:ROK family transcriptional regulator [Actinomycetaceae bacterium]